jgi:hypothetical protein
MSNLWATPLRDTCPNRRNGTMPNCNTAVTVPMESTLPPRLPDFSPQRQQKPQNPHGAAVKRANARPIKLFGKIVVIGAVAVGAWFVYDSHKPELFAKVQVYPKVLRITNGNDTAWNSTRIILNDGFAGPILDVAGVWPPKETRQLPLTDFQGRFNHQFFNPDYERVREITIQVHGFRLGIYRTH